MSVDTLTDQIKQHKNYMVNVPCPQVVVLPRCLPLLGHCPQESFYVKIKVKGVSEGELSGKPSAAGVHAQLEG